MNPQFQALATAIGSPQGISGTLEVATTFEEVMALAPMTLMYPDQEVQNQVMDKATELAQTEEEVQQVRHMASEVLGIPYSSFMNTTDWRKQLIRKFAAIRLGKPADELQG